MQRIIIKLCTFPCIDIFCIDTLAMYVLISDCYILNLIILIINGVYWQLMLRWLHRCAHCLVT